MIRAVLLDTQLSNANIIALLRSKIECGAHMHLDSRAVVATHWESIVEAGHATGYRVRLLETEGRNVQLGLRSFRAPQTAQKVGRADYATMDLAVEGDRVTVPLRPHEWAELEVRFG